MATVAEELFLYGEVEAEPLTGIWAIIAYSDLMLAGSLAFAFVILATLAASHWECLSSLIIFTLTHIIICVRSTVDEATWLLKRIASARSCSDLSNIYHAIAKALVTKGFESLPGRFMTAVVEWYFPFNKPETTLLRLAITIIYCQTFHSLVISGVLPYIIVLKHYLKDMVAQHSANRFDMSKEVQHLEAFAIVTICLSVSVSLWFLKTTLVGALTFQKPHDHPTATPTKTSSISAESPTNSPSRIGTERLATIIKLEDTIRQQRVQLAEQTTALEAANQATDQVRRELATESAIRNELQGRNERLCDGNLTLRKQLARKNRELDVARRRARLSNNEVDAKAEALTARIQDLEEKLHEKGREAEKAIRLKDQVDANTEILLITVKQLEERLEENERQLDMAADFKKEVEAEAKELHNTVIALERRLKNETATKLRTSEDKATGLEKHLAEKTRECEQAIESMNVFKARAGTLQEQLNEKTRLSELDTESKVQDLTKKLVEIEEQLAEKIREFEREVDVRAKDLTGTIARLEQELAKKTKASELDAEVIKNLNLEVSHLEEQLTECERNFDSEVDAKLHYLNDKVAHLSQQLSQKETHSQHEAEARATLARKAAQLEEELNECIKNAESEANVKVELRNKIVTLEQQLAVQAINVCDSIPHEVEALRADLQSYQSQVTAMYTSLENASAVEQQLRDQFLQKDADMQKLVHENTELTSQNITITLEHESLKAAQNEMSERLKNALDTLQEKHDQISCLEIDQFEILFDRDQARDALENANQILEETKATEARHQQTIQDIRPAYEMTIKHERGRVEALQAEIVDFQNKIGMAMRDAQRSQEQACKAGEKVKALEQQLAKQEKAPADQEASKLQVSETKLEQCTAKLLEQETEIHELRTKMGVVMQDAQQSHDRAVSAERTAEVLQHRLSKLEKAGTGQVIPKRQMTNPGSVATALEQSKLTIVEQQAHINNLQQQLNQSKVAGSGTPNDAALEQQIRELRGALENEKRDRAEDQVRWGRKTRELEEELQKLRISASQMRATPGLRRGRGR